MMKMSPEVRAANSSWFLHKYMTQMEGNTNKYLIKRNYFEAEEKSKQVNLNMSLSVKKNIIKATATNYCIIFNCMYIQFPIHLPADRHSHCLHALTIVNNATVNVGEQVSLPNTDFNSIG